MASNLKVVPTWLSEYERGTVEHSASKLAYIDPDNDFDDEQRKWATGGCGILAQELHKQTGWPLYGWSNEEERSDPSHKEFPFHDHVFVQHPSGQALDARGLHPMPEHAESLGLDHLNALFEADALPGPHYDDYEDASDVAKNLIGSHIAQSKTSKSDWSFDSAADRDQGASELAWSEPNYGKAIVTADDQIYTFNYDRQTGNPHHEQYMREHRLTGPMGFYYISAFGEVRSIGQNEELLRGAELVAKAIGGWVKGADDWNFSKVAGATRAQLLQQAQDHERQHGPDLSEPVHQFDDGWTVNALTTYGDMHREGQLMSNCFSPVDTYDQSKQFAQTEWEDYPGTEHPDEEDEEYAEDDPPEYNINKAHLQEPIGSSLYSLRDPDNLPHVSIDPNEGSWYGSALGKHNSAPKPEHLKRLADWANTDPEVRGYARDWQHSAERGLAQQKAMETLSHKIAGDPLLKTPPGTEPWEGLDQEGKMMVFDGTPYIWADTGKGIHHFQAVNAISGSKWQWGQDITNRPMMGMERSGWYTPKRGVLLADENKEDKVYWEQLLGLNPSRDEHSWNFSSRSPISAENYRMNHQAPGPAQTPPDPGKGNWSALTLNDGTHHVWDIDKDNLHHAEYAVKHGIDFEDVKHFWGKWPHNDNWRSYDDDMSRNMYEKLFDKEQTKQQPDSWNFSSRSPIFDWEDQWVFDSAEHSPKTANGLALPDPSDPDVYSPAYQTHDDRFIMGDESSSHEELARDNGH